MNMNTNQQITFFKPPVVTEHNLHRLIGDAYRIFGMQAPTKAVDVRKRLEADANAVHLTVNRLAAGALEPDSDIDAWHADALEQIRDAQARQDLAQAFGREFQRHVFATAPKYQALAYTDLEKHVGKTIARLEAAAKHLPAGAAALDPEAVLAADAGKHLTVAREALSVLAVTSSIHLPIMDRETPLPLRNMAAIVDYPDATIEQVQQDLSYDIRTLNGDDIAGALEIRAIANHANDHGVDVTVVAIARGDFPGTRLSYADRAALRQRRRNLVNAYSREVIRAH